MLLTLLLFGSGSMLFLLGKQNILNYFGGAVCFNSKVDLVYFLLFWHACLPVLELIVSVGFCK